MNVASCAVAALCALAVCGYRYGIFDQGQYLVSVIAMQSPGALGDDPYPIVFGDLRSVFWPLIDWISEESTRPVVCLIITILVTMLNAGLLTRIGRAILDPRSRGARVAPTAMMLAALVVAVVFVVPKEQNWFGLVSLGDVELTATLAVLPLVLGSALAWVRGRPWVCLALGLGALPVHGQTGAYLLTAWWAASVWMWRREAARLAVVLVIGCIGACAVLLVRRAMGVPLEELAALKRIGHGLYPELIDPRSGPWTSWGAVAAVLALGALSAWRLGAARSAPERRLRGWGVATLVFPVVGVALHSIGTDEPLLWRLMVGRSLMLPQIVALTMFAVWAVRAMMAGTREAVVAAGCLLIVSVWPVAYVDIGVMAGALLAVLAGVALTPVAPRDSAGLRAGRSAGVHRRIVLGCGVSVLAMLIVASVQFSARRFPWLESGEHAAWLDVQRWARDTTAPGTAFVTPPYLSGWRVASHRPTFGEVKDGRVLFYSGRTVIDWARRMDRLGMGQEYVFLETYRGDHVPPAVETCRQEFQRAMSRAGRALMSTHGIEYMVLERARDVPIGQPVWSNAHFVVRRISDSNRIGARSRSSGEPTTIVDASMRRRGP